MKAQAQITIHSLNDIITSINPPLNPYLGEVWVDTSVSPPITKIYNGTSWKEQNSTDDIKEDIVNVKVKQSSFETNIDGLLSTVSVLTKSTDKNTEDISVLSQSEEELSAKVLSKVDTSFGTSTSSFGWKLDSNGFYLYSKEETVMSVNSTSLTIKGAITATSGSLSEMTITGKLYFGGNTSYYISANYNDSNYYINLPGLKIDKASTAIFTGKLSSPSGSIGGFTISTSSIYKNKMKYDSTSSGVYIGTDGIGLGEGSFYVTSSGYFYATNGKIGGVIVNENQLFSKNFILGTVYDKDDNTKSFTTLSFGTTDGTTFSATTVITNSGSYFNSLSSNQISAGVITMQSIRADASISTTTGLYFGIAPDSTQYYAEISWSGSILYLKIYNSSGVLTKLTSAKSFVVYFKVVWGNNTSWSPTINAGESEASVNTNAVFGIDYATFNYSSSNKSQHTLYFTVSGPSASTTITSRGHIVPYYNNTYDLGSAANKWNNIYGQAGTINTSDKKEKKDIKVIDEKYSQIFDSLKPVTFSYIDNQSGRTHVGLIAEEVKEAILNSGLTTKEFAGYCEWENEDKSIGSGLRYSEFVPINIYEIKKLKDLVKNLNNRIKTLEERYET